jgi:hypothetical protein
MTRVVSCGGGIGFTVDSRSQAQKFYCFPRLSAQEHVTALCGRVVLNISGRTVTEIVTYRLENTSQD